jgi:nucleoside-diphosphate-sugar epimerase
VVASSGDVYFAYDQVHGREPWDGVQPGPLDEDAPLRVQLYPYGRRAETPKGTFVDYDKILVERVVLDAGATVLRLPKVWGPGDPGTLVSTALRTQLVGEPVAIAAAHARWRWTHGYVEDVAHAIGLAALSPRARVYNVGERDTPTLADRLHAIVIESGGLAVPIAHAVDLVMATERIRAELGYAELVEPALAVQRTLTASHRP